ncbi:MAG: sulfurtransferase TusA family protein [Sulfuricella sp.]|nr:sulfurtransferase TusA family protein [Sulfuricella sp.]
MNAPLPLQPTVTLNLSGLSCPHPLLGAKKVLNDLNGGDVLLLISDCPGTQDDLFSWASLTDNEIIKTGKNDDGAGQYFIRKGKRALPAFQVSLDMRGATCPGPIIEARKILEAMHEGEVLRLVSSCSAARDDMQTWAVNTAHTLLETNEIEPGILAFYIRK